jgi:hypothetical protein
LSTTHSISLGLALVAGKKRVPKPATGKTAFTMGLPHGLNDQNMAKSLRTNGKLALWLMASIIKISYL